MGLLLLSFLALTELLKIFPHEIIGKLESSRTEAELELVRFYVLKLAGNNFDKHIRPSP